MTADLGNSEPYSSVRSPESGTSSKRRRTYRSTQKIVSKNEKTYVNIVESYRPVKKRAISLRNTNSEKTASVAKPLTIQLNENPITAKIDPNSNSKHRTQISGSFH